MSRLAMSRRHGLRLLAAAAAVLAVAPAARAADFAGKTIEWVIPFSVGGGSDVWARFFAPLLAEQLPGRPTVVVKNVPGGGSITGSSTSGTCVSSSAVTAAAISSATASCSSA